MTISKTVPVRFSEATDRGYDILIRSGSLSEAATWIGDHVSDHHCVVITDRVVAGLYLDTLLDQLRGPSRRVDRLIVDEGEKAKSIEQAAHLWNGLLELKTGRTSSIIALGGGVIGDLAGFMAATFARGIDLIQIPTTLLAQVDSSVGGKVGINLPLAKNIVGAFWQPRAVLIDPHTLQSLDDRNYRAGLAEVVKYGVIMDEALFRFLENHVDEIRGRSPEVLTELIAWCCDCKARIVQADERELSGRRAILNYGHTFGHAIETVYGYGHYLHGEAVAIGMTCAARLAVKMGLVEQGLFHRQTELLKSLELPTELPTELEAGGQDDDWVSAMEHDKKVAAGKLYLILPMAIGNVIRVEAPDKAMLLESLRSDRVSRTRS